jgi:hypothetical protein
VITDDDEPGARRHRWLEIVCLAVTALHHVLDHDTPHHRLVAWRTVLWVCIEQIRSPLVFRPGHWIDGVLGRSA